MELCIAGLGFGYKELGWCIFFLLFPERALSNFFLRCLRERSKGCKISLQNTVLFA
jgi:hypothetical protein